MLGAGTVALVYGFTWVFLLVMQGRPAKPAKPWPAWQKWTYGLVMLVNLGLLVGQGVSGRGPGVGGFILMTSALVVVLPAVSALIVVSRRAMAAGTYPRARSAPVGLFWFSVVGSGLAVVVSIGAAAEQIALGHPC